MKIDWLQVPSEFTHAHQSSADPLNVVFTNCPMLEKDGRLFYPYNELVSCHVRKVFAWPEGVLQVSRPVSNKVDWSLLPEDVDAIEVVGSDDGNLILKDGVDVRSDHITAGEIVRRMNLKPGVYWRPKVGDGECIHMAVDVMRAQRAKGLEKYGQPLEANNGFTLPQMVRMAQEELADGAVYLAKVQMMIERLQHLADHGDIDAIRKVLQG